MSTEGSAPGASRDVDAIARALEHHDPPQLVYQWQEIVGRRTYVRHGIEVAPGDVVFDVGANVGVAAAFFSAVCGARSVHSFEPIPALFDLLQRNVSPYPGCVAHEYGLSSSNRHATMTYYPGAAAMSGLYADPERDRELVRACMINSGRSAAEVDAELEGRYEPVTVACELRTLSSVLRSECVDCVDLLKIDVEQAELDVLEGVADNDWPRIGQVVAEVHDLGGRLAEVTGLLIAREFDLTVEQDEIMRGTPVHMVYARRLNTDPSARI